MVDQYLFVMIPYVFNIVHLRKRKSDNGKLRSPSTSAITYWQIEKDKPLSGRQLAVASLIDTL